MGYGDAAFAARPEELRQPGDGPLSFPPLRDFLSASAAMLSLSASLPKTQHYTRNSPVLVRFVEGFQQHLAGTSEEVALARATTAKLGRPRRS